MQRGKVENAIVEILRGLDQLMKRKESGGMYLLWVPLIGDVRTLMMDEARASRYLVHSGANKTYYDLRDMYGVHVWRRILLPRLPRLSSGYDTNWVIVDRLTKVFDVLYLNRCMEGSVGHMFFGLKLEKYGRLGSNFVNNSVFRGFFEKQKLTGPNFIDWYRQLRIVLLFEDKLNYLELPIPATPVPPVAGQQVPSEILAAHAAWVKGQKEIDVLMLMTMKPDLQRNLETLGAYDMLKELKTLFSQQAE
ncbi:hypothetical protein Tco_1134107 [Tanacetum coccineum]